MTYWLEALLVSSPVSTGWNLVVELAFDVFPVAEN